MSVICLNKDTKEFKDLVSAYGENMAESIVRSMTRKLGNSRGIPRYDFYVPTLDEARLFLIDSAVQVQKSFESAMDYGDPLSETALYNLLEGVISKLEGKYYVVTGDVPTRESILDIFNPRFDVIKALSKRYGDVISYKEHGNRKVEVYINSKGRKTSDISERGPKIVKLSVYNTIKSMFDTKSGTERWNDLANKIDIFIQIGDILSAKTGYSYKLINDPSIKKPFIYDEDNDLLLVNIANFDNKVPITAAFSLPVLSVIKGNNPKLYNSIISEYSRVKGVPVSKIKDVDVADYISEMIISKVTDIAKGNKNISDFNREFSSLLKDLLKEKEIEIASLPDEITLDDLANLAVFYDYVIPTDVGVVKYYTFDKVDDDLMDNFSVYAPDPYFPTWQSAVSYIRNIASRIEKNVTSRLAKNLEKVHKKYIKSKATLSAWKRINNIKYNPEDAYELGFGFYHDLGLHSVKSANDILTTILYNIELFEKSGAGYYVSFYNDVVKTDKPINENVLVRLVIYPSEEDIDWISVGDVYSEIGVMTSFHTAWEHELGRYPVSTVRHPSARTINELSPSVKHSILNNVSSYNEGSVRLRGNNFRLEIVEDNLMKLPSNVRANIRNLVEHVNKELDEKYGKVKVPTFGNKRVKGKFMYKGEVFDNLTEAKNAKIEDLKQNAKVETITELGESEPSYIIENITSEEYSQELEEIERKYFDDTVNLLRVAKEMKSWPGNFILPSIGYMTEILYPIVVEKASALGIKIGEDFVEYVPNILYNFVKEEFLSEETRLIWNLVKDQIAKFDITFSLSVSSYNIYGSFEPVNERIWIYHTALENMKIFSETLVHEAIHALTFKTIKKYLDGDLNGLTDKQISALKELDGIFKKYNHLFRIDDLYEFVAYISDPFFAKILKRKNKAIVNKISDLVSRIIVGKSGTNEFEVAQTLLSNLIAGKHSIVLENVDEKTESKESKQKKADIVKAYNRSIGAALMRKFDKIIKLFDKHGFTLNLWSKLSNELLLRDDEVKAVYKAEGDTIEERILQIVSEIKENPNLVEVYFPQKIELDSKTELVSAVYYEKINNLKRVDIMDVVDFTDSNVGVYSKKASSDTKIKLALRAFLSKFNTFLKEGGYISLSPNVENFEEIKTFLEKQGLLSDVAPDGRYLFRMQKPTPETQRKRASKKVEEAVFELLNKLGVKYKSVDSIVYNGKVLDVNGLADTLRGVIEVMEGKEAEALPEEVMHILVDVIEANDPKLFSKLMKEINKYSDTLNETFEQYKDNPNYQTEDGKPNIIKIKKEAIAKQLVKTLIQKSTEGIYNEEHISLLHKIWKEIVQFIKNLFASRAIDKVAIDVLKGKDFGKVSDVKEGDVYFQMSEQETVYNKIKERSRNVVKENDEYFLNGRRLTRVTTIAKSFIDRIFEDRKLSQTEYEKALDEIKRETGSKAHEDVSHIISLFVDENGFLREQPLDDSNYVPSLRSNNDVIYNTIKNYIKGFLESYPEGTRFVFEETIYDESRNVGGTPDFIAIMPDGKVDVIDWKFIEKPKIGSDIPWYSINYWNSQMGQYMNILEKAYGVNPRKFNKTRMIPFIMVYEGGSRQRGVLPTLKAIRVGNKNVRLIQEEYLLPVVHPREKTGDNRVDNLIEKLNAMYELIYKGRVKEEDRQAKIEILNKLFRAIRLLQVKGDVAALVEEANVVIQRSRDIIRRYREQMMNADPNSFSDAEISNFVYEVEYLMRFLEIFSDMDINLSNLIRQDRSLIVEVGKASQMSKVMLHDMRDIFTEFVDLFIAGRENIKGSILSPEKVVKGISRLFLSISSIQMKSMEVFYKKVNRSLFYAQSDIHEENTRLLKLKEAYDQWATANGLSKNEYFDIIKKKGKNELIDKYKLEFFRTLRQKVKDRDYEWIRQNIDVDAFAEETRRIMEKEIEKANNRPIVGHSEEEARLIREHMVRRIMEKYDILSPLGQGWLNYNILKRFPSSRWYSEEWIKLNKPENRPALDLYNYIVEKNKEYRKIGYLGNQNANLFLPFVKRGLVERMFFGSNLKLGESFLKSITIDEDDYGYGKYDPITGELIDEVPRYFTRPISGDISEDLFKNMALYNEAAIRYKYLTEIEPQIRALISIEKNKKAIATSYFGRVIYQNGEVKYSNDNSENAQLLEDMVKHVVYGQRYVSSQNFDAIMGRVGDFGKRINNKLGFKLFPENLEGRQFSMNKVIDFLDNWFRLSVLGLNPKSALSNLMGGTFSSIINAGKYFTKADYERAVIMLTMKRFTDMDHKLYLKALEFFMPYTENVANREIIKNLSRNKFNESSLTDFLMVLMRKTDLFVQSANFYAYLENSAVIDGEIVNVREYLRNTEKYRNMLSKPRIERARLQEEFEKDVKNLVNEKGVMKLARIRDGKFYIEGIDQKSKTVAELRRKVQAISKAALGNLSEDDTRLIRLNVYGKAFMSLMNWIPRTVDVRFGALKYNSATDAYEWGRARTIFRILAEDTIKSLKTLYDIYTLNDEGIERLRKLYERKAEEYRNATNKELYLDEELFMELVRENVRAALVEAIFMLIMTSIFLAIVAMDDDDEEDPRVRNIYKYVKSAVDKVKDELMFYYDPTSMFSILSSGIFPFMTLVNNLKRLIFNFAKEVFGIIIDDEKIVDDTYVIKYLMKTFPLSRQFTQWLPLIAPDFAKELGIRVNEQGRPIGMR